MRNAGRFVFYYVKSMRLYYAFVTGIAGWIGIAFYRFKAPEQFVPWKGLTALVMLFLAWGINQIVNDYLGQKEDRVNAPHRPMVNGDLNPELAIGVSAVLLLFVLLVTWFLNPWALIPAIAGIFLNILYEYAKARGLLGNVVFGLSIATCTVYGGLASGPLLDPLYTTNRFSGLILVAVLNGLMTYYTYFKDYLGDKAADKRTFIVRYGVNIGRHVGILGGLLTGVVLWILMTMRWLPVEDIVCFGPFVFCCFVALFLQIWTAGLYFAHPSGDQAYFNLATNIRACVAGEAAVIAIFDGQLALYLLAASYILIGFFFNMYSDAKA